LPVEEKTIMADCWLHVDLAGIQNYVFRSRELLDAIGRAAQVEDLTDEQFLRDEQVLGPSERVVSRGAGTMTLAAPTEDAARAVAARYSRLVTDRSDALQPVMALRPDVDDPAAELQGAADVMRRARHGRLPDLPPVTPLGGVRCAVTGAPAESVEDGMPLGGDVAAARRRARDWHRAQQAYLLRDAPLPAHEPGWALPTRIDQLGRTEGEHSQVAVLVADVNDLGTTLSLLADDGNELTEAGAHIRRVTDALATALVHRVAQAIEPDGDRMRVTGFPDELTFLLHLLTEDVGKTLLPVRPWVIAGDDLVLLCDARLSWSLADAAMRWLDDGDDPSLRALRSLPAFVDTPARRALTLGIGIAVVPVGYSLRHAHEIAKKLCDDAKAVRRHRGWHGHVVDWHRGAVPADAVLAARALPGAVPLARPLVHDRPEDTLHAPGRQWGELLYDGLSSVHEGSMRRRDRNGEPAGWAAHGGWLRSELPQELRAGPRRTGQAIRARSARQRQLTREGLPPLLTGRDVQRLTGESWGDPPPRFADALDLAAQHLELGMRQEDR
jgi:hypothetical protein